MVPSRHVFSSYLSLFTVACRSHTSHEGVNGSSFTTANSMIQLFCRCCPSSFYSSLPVFLCSLWWHWFCFWGAPVSMLWTWTFYPGRSMLPALPSRRNLEQILKDFFRRWGRGRLVSSICSFRFPRISGCYDSDTSVGLTKKTTLGFILSSLQSTAGALLHNGLLAISPSSTMDRKGSLKLMNSN